jgi:hypothetical protein
LQNPLFQKAKEKYVPGEKVLVRVDEGWGNALPRPSATVWDAFPLPEVEGLLFDHGFCDSALRLRAEWRNCRKYPGFRWHWRESTFLFLWSRFYSPDFSCLWTARRQGREVCYRSFPIILRECSLDLPN